MTGELARERAKPVVHLCKIRNNHAHTERERERREARDTRECSGVAYFFGRAPMHKMKPGQRCILCKFPIDVK